MALPADSRRIEAAREVPSKKYEVRSTAVAVFALAVATACTGEHRRGSDGTLGSGDAAPELAREATLTGCIAERDHGNTLLFVALGDNLGSSTTPDIGWHGTRQL